MTPTETVERIKGMLEGYKADIGETITTLKAAGDGTSGKVADLEAKLVEVTDGLKKVEESREKAGTFGLPGFDDDEQAKGNWHWGNWLSAATAVKFALARGEMPNIDKTWQRLAPYERDVMQAYGQRRKVEIAQVMEKQLELTQTVQKTFNADDGSEGGFLIPPAIYQGDVIEPVYAATPILNFPVLKLPGIMSDDLPIPVDAGNLTAYHVGESGKPTVSTSSYELHHLRPRKIGIFTKMTTRMIAMSNRAVQAMIQQKMSRDGSVELSRGLTNGVGASSEPKGITTYTGMTTGPTAATNGARFNVDNAQAMRMKLAASNELRDSQTYGYLMRPEALFGMLRERVQMFSGQSRANGMPVVSPSLFLTEDVLQSALKSTFGHTTQLSATQTQGTSPTCSTVYYGDWSLFAFATFREPRFNVSTVAGDGGTGSAFLEDQVYMVMFFEYDCQLLREAAFTSMAGAETNDGNWTT